MQDDLYLDLCFCYDTICRNFGDGENAAKRVPNLCDYILCRGCPFLSTNCGIDFSDESCEERARLYSACADEV